MGQSIEQPNNNNNLKQANIVETIPTREVIQQEIKDVQTLQEKRLLLKND